ncbi:MAG TPA: cupin domain-containing protein [Solirubrobacteraceae bacterium]|nr:cupin domain-containing protein [Solirubrobacteraceae bacterium]
MQRTDTDHALVSPDEGETIEAAGNRITIKVASPGHLVCDYLAAPRFAGPPVHVHPGFDETYVMLEGRLEVVIRDERSELVPGAVAYVSGAVPHTFSNPYDQPARFLSICAPGGFEHFFRAVASRDQDAIAVISERFGYKAVDRAG